MSKLNNEKLLKEAIRNSQNQSEVLEYIGLRPAGGNFKSLQKYAELFNLTLPKRDYAELKIIKYTDE